MRAIVAILALAAASAARAEDPISPADAAKKLGDKVSMKMEVKSAALIQSGVCYLNSHEDFKHADNFVVFLPKATVEKFKGAMVDNPAKHFKGKKVIVTGTVTSNKGKAQIKIDNVDQLKLADG